MTLFNKKRRSWCLVMAFFLQVVQLQGAEPEGLADTEPQKRTAAGGLSAQIELATRQLDGRSNDFDPEFILETFKRGVKEGDAKAYTGLAICHRRAIGMDFNDEPVMAYFEKAAQLGDPEGTLQLGAILLKRGTRHTDTARGMKLCEKAAAMGSHNAKALIAILVATGDSWPRDTEKGLADLHELLETTGNPMAASYLGWHFHHVMKDVNKAEKYYRMAAEKNNVDAMVTVGDLLGKEKRGGKDVKAERANWYRRAIARGSAEALRKLALMQRHDPSIRQKGEDWYQMLLDADRKGDGEATLKLANINHHAYEFTFRDLDWSKTAHYDWRYITERRASSFSYQSLHMSLHRLLELYFEGGLGLDRDYKRCLEIAQPHLGTCEEANMYAGRILLLADAPMGNTREHFIRGYACMLSAQKIGHTHLGSKVDNDVLFVLRSRHGMTREEVAQAEQLSNEGFPNPQTPLLP